MLSSTKRRPVLPLLSKRFRYIVDSESLRARFTPTRRVLLTYKELFSKMEDRRWFGMYPRKFRGGWIEEEVMFPRDHKRRGLQDGTRSGIEPPVAHLFGIQVLERRVFA